MKQKIKIRCHFCKKDISVKIYIVKHGNIKYKVCSECKEIYVIINNKAESGKLIIVEKIFNIIKNKSRHCTICKHFRIGRTDECYRHYYTGLGGTSIHRSSYPNSYANHGCSYFCLCE